MELRSDQIKRGVARAPHRSLLKADGITDEEMDRPFIAVLNARNDIIPGHTNLDKIAEAVKAGIYMWNAPSWGTPSTAWCASRTATRSSPA